jgi:O-glycosyl hydrolase
LRIAVVVAAAGAAVAALAAFVDVSGTSTKARPANVVVDLGKPLQLMQGFGTSERVWSDPHLANAEGAIVPESAQREILAALYQRLGLTRLRPVLDNGVQDPRGAPFDFPGRLVDDHVALVKQAKAFGLRTFFPGPVLMEPWMTENDVDAMVEWAMQMLLYWRSMGLEPPLYAPLNEPAINKNFAPEWMHQVVLRLGERMRQAGLKTMLVIPDDENPVAAYKRAAPVLEDPAARKYVAAVAFHIYNGTKDDWLRLRQLAQRHGLPLWMTEWNDRAFGSWPGALGWAVTIHDLITVGGVSAVDYIWGFFGDWRAPSETMITLEFDGGRYRGLQYNPVYWITGQWSRFVRPGYRRVSTTGLGSSHVTGFTGDGRVVVVAINQGDGPKTVRVSVTHGRVRGPATAVRSSKTENWKSLPSVPVKASAFTAVLAPQSVTTYLVQRVK